MAGYHICRDCIYGTTIEAEQIVYGHRKYVAWKCSQSKARVLWALRDERAAHTCPAFVPIQNKMEIENLPTAEPLSINLNQGQSSDMISRQAALEACRGYFIVSGRISRLPPAEPQERKTEKALRLLLEWAIECDFGYDNIPEEYEKYKDDIEGMSYTDGLIYIARMEVDNGRNNS